MSIKRQIDLTVMIPIYNHARYLVEALESILNQTCLPKRVILIDDASSDETPVIASEYAGNYDFFEFVQNKSRLGTNRAINLNLPSVKTEYVFFMAADDSIHPQLFEEAFRLFTKYPSAGVFSALSGVINKKSDFTGYYYSPVVRHSSSYLLPEECRKLYRADGNWSLGFTRISKMKLVREANNFFEDLRSFSDTYMSILITLKHGACFCPRYLSKGRITEGSYSAEVLRDAGLRKEIMQQAEKKFLDEGCFNKVEVRIWKKRFMRTSLIALTSYNDSFNLKRIKKFIPNEFSAIRQSIVIFYPLIKLRIHFLNGIIFYALIRPKDLFRRVYRFLFYTTICRFKSRNDAYFKSQKMKFSSEQSEVVDEVS